MIKLEQALQDLRIDEQETPFGDVWHSLTVKEIEQIKHLFLMSGFRQPGTPAEMVVGKLVFERFTQLLCYEIEDISTPRLIELVAIACEID